MANQLNELDPVVMDQGLDVNVIAKQLPVTVGAESFIFQASVWLSGLIPLAFGIVLVTSEEAAQNVLLGGIMLLLAIAPGLTLYFTKQSVDGYLRALEQRVQAAASRIDNYLEQRVVVLKNCAKLLDKQMNFERETLNAIVALRSGGKMTDAERNEVAAQIEKASSALQVNVEAYPTLQSIKAIQDAMKQNMYLQHEITAARDLYNSEVLQWNSQIFAFPLRKIVAAKNHYTTRIPFITSKEIKEQARGVFF